MCSPPKRLAPKKGLKLWKVALVGQMHHGEILSDDLKLF